MSLLGKKKGYWTKTAEWCAWIVCSIISHRLQSLSGLQRWEHTSHKYTSNMCVLNWLHWSVVLGSSQSVRRKCRDGTGEGGCALAQVCFMIVCAVYCRCEYLYVRCVSFCAVWCIVRCVFRGCCAWMSNKFFHRLWVTKQRRNISGVIIIFLYYGRCFCH